MVDTFIFDMLCTNLGTVRVLRLPPCHRIRARACQRWLSANLDKNVSLHTDSDADYLAY